MKTRKSNIHILAECALMIALSTALSYLTLFRLPHGGSITPVSMLPVIAVSYRHGTRWGLLTAFAHSLLQLMQGLGNLSYCQSWGAAVGCILFDYIIAYTVLGLAGAVGRAVKNRAAAAGLGTLAVCAGRYLCSVFSGFLVWRDYLYAVDWMTALGWGERIASLGADAVCWLYSAVYNGMYLGPESLLTALAAVLLLPRLTAKDPH